MNNKVYYKVLDKNMESPLTKFQYELGNTYSTDDEELEICENGFHACKNMYEMIIWSYNILLKDCRFFECVLGDKIIEGEHKVVSSSITLTKEISYEEVDKNIRENLNLLIHDEDWFIRKVVADHGYGLDVLVHDIDEVVRSAVADQGYGLDILVHDESWFVRKAVAHQGYDLDVLVHDKDWCVRVVANYMQGGISNE